MVEKLYLRGLVVLVPFPFTDLSGKKRRPALVVSPEGFRGDDFILCAITSRVPRRLSEWEVLIEATDMADRRLPKKSVIRVDKLFTMHRSLIAGRFGLVEERELAEVLGKLRTLFMDGTGR